METFNLRTLFYAIFISGIISPLISIGFPIIILLICSSLDILTGFINGYINNEASSKISSKGILKKCCFYICILLGKHLDLLITEYATFLISDNYFNLIGITMTTWFILNEMLSIMENLKKLNVPLPKFFTRILEHLQSSIGKE